MARLRVREQAEKRGLSLSQLHAAVNRRLPLDDQVALGTMRRYWYSTKNGSEHGTEIVLVDIHLLGTIARALELRVSDLVNEDEVGQARAVLCVA